MSTLKIVDLGYRLSLSVACMVRFWFISFQNLTVHKTSLVQVSPFLLAVYTHDMPLCLCSVFCTRSQVQLSTARYHTFGARTTPRTVSRNLNIYSTSPLFLWQQVGIIFHILTGSCRFCRFCRFCFIYPRSCKMMFPISYPVYKCKLLSTFTNNIQ